MISVGQALEVISTLAAVFTEVGSLVEGWCSTSINIDLQDLFVADWTEKLGEILSLLIFHCDVYSMFVLLRIFEDKGFHGHFAAWTGVFTLLRPFLNAVQMINVVTTISVTLLIRDLL